MTAALPAAKLAEGYRILQASFAAGQGLLGTTSHLLASAGTQVSDRRQKIVLEYSSPNVAKPFHVGHLRSTLIGQVLANAYALKGHEVTRLNWLGDWGGQFGVLAAALQDSTLEPRKLNVLELYRVYVGANSRAEQDPAFLERCRAMSKLLETRSDPELMEQWRDVRKLSLAEFSQLYDRFHVSFDAIDSESDYAQSGKDLVSHWLSQGRLDIVDGHIGLKCSEENLDKITPNLHRDGFLRHVTNFITLGRPDGSAVYLSRDLAALIDRFSRYRFDNIFYVVGAEQTAHMESIRLVIDLVGGMPELASRLVHVPFKKVTGMSTRRGTAVFVDELLAKGEVETETFLRTFSNAKIDEHNRDRIVREFATGSWIVKNFSHPRTEAYQFNWKLALKQGASRKTRTVARLLYCYARLCSLVAKCDGLLLLANSSGGVASHDVTSIANAQDTMLSRDQNSAQCVSNLIRLAGAIDKILLSSDPHDFIPDLFSAIDAINVALRECKVIGETDQNLAKQRLGMFKIAKQLIFESCQLICIDPLEEI